MSIPESVGRLERDLRGIFGPRLSSLTMYGLSDARSAKAEPRDAHAHGHARPATHTLAIVDSLSSADLRACAAQLGVTSPL